MSFVPEEEIVVAQALYDLQGFESKNPVDNEARTQLVAFLEKMDSPNLILNVAAGVKLHPLIENVIASLKMAGLTILLKD